MPEIGDQVRVLSGTWRGQTVIVAHIYQSVVGRVFSVTLNGIGRELTGDQLEFVASGGDVVQ